MSAPLDQCSKQRLLFKTVGLPISFELRTLLSGIGSTLKITKIITLLKTVGIFSRVTAQDVVQNDRNMFHLNYVTCLWTVMMFISVVFVSLLMMS